MAVYLILATVLFLSGILLDRMKWKYSRLIYCIVAWASMFGVSGLRYTTGYDYNLYAAIYVDSVKWNYDRLCSERMEKGFSVIMKYLSSLNADYRPFLVAIAFVIITLVMVYIYKYSESPYISVTAFLFFGLFFNSMNFMRQMIAALIICFALKYVKEKHFFRYLLIVLFASCFHISVLIMIPFYFILQIKMNIISLSVMSAVAMLSFVFSENIIEFVTKFYYEGRGFEDGGLNPIYTLFFICLFVPCIIMRKQLVEKDPMNNMYIVMLFMAIVAEFIGIKYGVISRFAIVFFIPPVVLLTPQLVNVLSEFIRIRLKGRKTKTSSLVILVNSVLFILGASMYIYYMSVNYNGVIPYETLFDSDRVSVTREVYTK